MAAGKEKKRGMEFEGYPRPDGSIGVRNHVLVLSTVLCTGPIPARVAAEVDGVMPITYRFCYPKRETLSVLRGVGANPNFGAVLIIGLSCEGMDYKRLGREISATGKSCAVLEVRASGGTIRATERAIELARDMVEECRTVKREKVGIGELTLGIKCGGSDATSGLAANPAVGEMVDMLVDHGATVIFSEPLECVGAKHILMRRAVNNEVAEEIRQLVDNSLSCYSGNGGGLNGLDNMDAIPAEHFMSPGNIAGGLTTLEEKSLGAVSKSGTRTITGVLDFAASPSTQGLFFMDSIGHELTDVGVLDGFLAAGAQIMVLTTGVGMATGIAGAPLIKVCGNPDTSALMEGNIDVDASPIISMSCSVKDIGGMLMEKVVRVASGEKVKAELLGYNDSEFSGITT